MRPAGYLSAKSCASGSAALDMWRVADTTGRQLFSVKRASGGGAGIMGVNVTIADVGRTSEGCAAFLTVGSATAGQCAITIARLGSAAGIGAQKWVLEAVPGGQPGLVYISNEVGARSNAGWQ